MLDKQNRIENAKNVLNKLKDFVRKNYKLVSEEDKVKLDVQLSIYNSGEVYKKKLKIFANLFKKEASGSAPLLPKVNVSGIAHLIISGSAPSPKPTGKKSKKF